MRVAVRVGIFLLTAVLSSACMAPGMKSGNHTIKVQDPHLGAIVRHFLLVVPDRKAPSNGHPLVLGFHGQGYTPSTWGPQPGFARLARKHNWAAVFPAGLEENGDKTWNTGASQSDNSTCVPDTTGTQCMDSCKRLKRCGRCNWATCYDDLAFIQQLLALLEQHLCLDPQNYFLTGESNGGMFLYSVAQQMPGHFRAIAPAFALPLQGYEMGPRFELIRQQHLARQTSILHLHDRNDTTIPWQGGMSSDGWLYASLSRNMGVWAAIHNCSVAPTVVTTPYSKGKTRQNVQCKQYSHCSYGRVMYCMYDGTHGTWIDQPAGDEIVMWFFTSHVNSTAAPL